MSHSVAITASYYPSRCVIGSRYSFYAKPRFLFVRRQGSCLSALKLSHHDGANERSWRWLASDIRMRIASNATFALKVELWFRRCRLLMGFSYHRHQAASKQKIHLYPLLKIPEPALTTSFETPAFFVSMGEVMLYRINACRD